MKEKSSRDFMPQYVSFMHDIIGRIHDGFYPPGGKLPSIRELALEYGVSRRVAHYAVGQLAFQNYLYTEPKSGIFVNPELRPGLFYRIGFLLNEDNPMECGTAIAAISRIASESMFKTVLINNYGQRRDLADFLKKDNSFDGFLLYGQVTETLASAVGKFKIPYMVIGNYEISERHPQCRTDVKGAVADALEKEFRPFAGKRIAALMGSRKYQSDRAATEGLKLAVERAGAVTSDSLIASCESDGYEECLRLMKQKPDVLYIRLSLRIGYEKYCLRNPDSPRPYVIYDSGRSSGAFHESRIFNKVITAASDEAVVENAVKQLIAMIHKEKKEEV